MVTAVGDIPAAKDFIVMCMIMILTVTAAKAMVVVIKIAVFKNIAATLAGLPEILSNMHPSTQDMKMSILATRRFMVLRYPLPYEHFHHIRNLHYNKFNMREVHLLVSTVTKEASMINIRTFLDCTQNILEEKLHLLLHMV